MSPADLNPTQRQLIFWKVRDIILGQLGKLREKRNLALSDDDIVEAGRDIMRALGFNKDELRLMGEMRAMCPDLPAHKDTTNVGT